MVGAEQIWRLMELIPGMFKCKGPGSLTQTLGLILRWEKQGKSEHWEQTAHSSSKVRTSAKPAKEQLLPTPF